MPTLVIYDARTKADAQVAVWPQHPASATFTDVAACLARREAWSARNASVKEAGMSIRIFPIVVLAAILALAGCDEEETEATETEEVEEVED